MYFLSTVILLLQGEELTELRSEVKGRPLRISFDETTIRQVVLCVIVGFVDDMGKMQQRVMKLGIYDESPEEKLTNQMSDHIIYAIEETLQVPRHNIKVFTRDGVYLNELCMTKLVGGTVTNPNDNKTTEIRGFFKNAVNVKCMSHTLDNCGADYTVRGKKFNRIEGPNAKLLYNQINGLFSGPGDTSNFSWKMASKTTMPSVSQTRWWSREEFWEYLMPFFRYQESKEDDSSLWFEDWVANRIGRLRAEKKSIGAHIKKLEETFVPGVAGYDKKFLITAFIEAAVVVDITKKVREATYLLEGDGPIAVMLIEVLDATKRYYLSTYEDFDYPNVRRHIQQAVRLNIAPPGFLAPAVVRIENIPDAVLPQPVVPPEIVPQALLPPSDLARDVAPDDGNEIAWDLEEAWKGYCRQLSSPFMNYFDEMVMAHNCTSLWQAASIADPLNMQRKTITPRELRSAVEPLVDRLVPPALVDRMVGELSEYSIACSGLNWKDDKYDVRLEKVEEFWSRHRLLPAWTEFAHIVFLLQPTSACVERAFSVLKYIMGDQQVASLQDKIEASLMLRYNRGIER